jgi:N-acetylglucosaminyldiphosphoundecaprenol N-acetyl-beta-D-mannosaminyltransferase
MNEIQIWGIKINPIRKVDIIKLIDKHLIEGDGLFQLTGVNPETIAKAQDNFELTNSINNSNIVNIDNMLVVTTLRILGYKIPERAACPDIFEMLLALSNSKGYTVYFLGSKEEILRTMVAKLKVKYPELKIVGSRNGYFCNASEELLIVEEISKIKPDMVFIALPTPQKELFISHYKNNLGVRFAFGVGGVFDVQAGKVKRAPLWMRNIGLEGLHRMIQNPADYGARYKTLYLPFIKLFFRELFKKNRI